MTAQRSIDPGPGHTTTFGFDGQRTVFETEPQAEVDRPSRSRTGREGNKDDGNIWVIHVPGEAMSIDDADDPFRIHRPGLVSPRQFTVRRAFSNLEEARAAVPEISTFANRAGALHARTPHLILRVAHAGALDPAQAISIVDDLRRADTHATIVVEHKKGSGA